MVRALSGTADNPYRHDDSDTGERRQMRLGIAGLCGWFENFTHAPVLTVLIQHVAVAIPPSTTRAGLSALPRARG
jgi:hypothetical protein